MNTRYAVIGLPPSSAGAVHFTFSEVSLMSAAVDVMLGGLGASELTERIHVFLFFFIFYFLK